MKVRPLTGTITPPPGGYKLENFAPTRHDRSDPSYERDRP